MKNHARKLTAMLLALAMTVGTINPVSFAAPAKTNGSSDDMASTGEGGLSSTAETNLASARIIASLGENEEDAGDSGEESKIKSVIRDAIFNKYNSTANLSKYNISSDEMESTTEEVLEETNLTDAVDVTYETDSDGNVTTADIQMDAMVAMAAEELQTSTVYNLTEEQTQKLLGTYAGYVQLVKDNADIFGVQVPYNTTKDTNANPIGSMLDVASIPVENAGYVGFDTLYGIVQLYYIATDIITNEDVSNYAKTIRDARDEALKSINDDMTTIEKYLALNSWLANHCTFSMGYIMESMEAPEPKVSDLYTCAYNYMYAMIQNQVYEGYFKGYQDAADAGQMDPEQVEPAARQAAEAYMITVPEDGTSGAQQAASTATSILGLWGGNQVGAFVAQDAVCLGYTSAYAYLIQCAFPEIYLKEEATDLNDASNWKSYEELNYVLDENGDPTKDENGDYVWSATETAAIIDYVKIKYDADVTMFGQESEGFGECHYWNAVRTDDGKWYYVDSCYTDIYIECMIRDRVETDGNMNHLYFMLSDDSARDLYKGNYEDIFTLYEGIATNKTYEDAWFAFAKSPVYYNNGRWYYFYDSTDMLNLLGQFGDYMSGNNTISSSNGVAAAAEDDANNSGFGDIFGDTEYKIVCKDAKDDADPSYDTVLVDFNAGKVLNPESEELEDNVLVAELYEEFVEYAEEYPSIAISTAYYDGKIYFSLSNCVLSYDLSTGEVKKLIEYTKVSGERDNSKDLGGMAFTMTDDASGADTITVENPPIADMTIKDDGKMYVSIATNYAFISGKDPVNINDGSSYGYMFAETNYNPDYNSYYSSSSEVNDNDEFMWSANIVGTVEMAHLTGGNHNYVDKTVAESCTEDAYSVKVCSDCGLIAEETPSETEDKTEENQPAPATEDEEVTDPEVKEEAVASLNVAVKTEAGQTLASTTLTDIGTKEKECKFTADEINEAVDKITAGLPEGYTVSEEAADIQDMTVPYGSSDSKEISVTVDENAVKVASLNITVSMNEQTLASTTLVKKAPSVDNEGEDDSQGNVPAEGEGTGDEVAVAEEGEGEPESEATFTADEIQAAVSGLSLPEGYVLEEKEVSDVSVAYGKEDAEAFTAAAEVVEAETAKATLTINVYDSAADQTAEEPLCSAVIVKEGEKDTACDVITAAEIKEAAEAALAEKAEGYTLDDSNTYAAPADLKYSDGEEGQKSISLTATKGIPGHGHKYVKSNETYYTKDDNGNWNTGSCYVCLYCGKSVETKEDITENDSIYEVKNPDEMEDVWVWSTDGTEASLYQVPEELAGYMIDCVWENSAVGSSRTVAEVTLSGNCAAGITYIAKVGDRDKSDEKKIETGGKHSYNKTPVTDAATGEVIDRGAVVGWEWAKDDCSWAKVTIRCDICGEERTLDAQVSPQGATENADSVTYAAVAVDENENQYYSSTRTVTNETPDKLEGVSCKGMSLNLEGKIGVNYYLALPEAVLADNDAYVEFAAPNGTTKVAVNKGELDKERDAYKFTAEVAAKEMADTVQCKVVSGGKSSDVFEYSVVKYADYVIKDTSGNFAKVVPLVRAMLTYGAYAQTYFKYNTDNLANAAVGELSEDEQAILAGVAGKVADCKSSVSGEGTFATIKGASLTLESETEINYIFELSDGTSINDLTFTCNGKELKPVAMEDGTYKVIVNQIAAKHLDENFTVKVTKSGETANYSATYGPYVYVRTVLEDTEGTYPDTLKELCKALYWYSQAANTYFE